MQPPVSRRSFLQRSAAAAVGMGFLAHLPRLSAEDGTLDTKFVRFSPEIEPLVRLLENTPRERLLEEVAERIKTGTTYRELLAAVLLAGVRNIQSRPLGFKFHAVLVVNSAHMASQNAPDRDRWLPLFWALDQFKSSQALDVKEGDWTMSAVQEKAVPGPDKARAEFIAAMDTWDTERADAAVCGLVRAEGAQEVFELFCRYGARDWRHIGHKAIYVANSWRTLQNIGWQHAEPVLRSLAYGLLEHEGESPAKRDDEADRPGRANLERLKKIRADWQTGEVSAAATKEMLLTVRQGTWEQASERAVELLNRGVAPQSLWDAFFHGAGEILMRKPGIVSLHAMTTANALHFAHRQTHDDATRRLLLLQCAAYLPLFRRAAGADKGVAIDEMEAAEGPASVDEIFADISRNKSAAAQKTLKYLQSGGGVRPLLDEAQRLIYMKGRDSHDYKFSSAIIEDHTHLAPALRDRFLAASVFWLQGSGAPDNALIARTRAALGQA